MYLRPKLDTTIWGAIISGTINRIHVEFDYSRIPFNVILSPAGPRIITYFENKSDESSCKILRTIRHTDGEL